VAAIERGCGRVVTVAMDEVVFHQPVHVGDLVSFYAAVVHTGRTSLKVRVEVEAFRRSDGTTVPVTQADVTYVHIDDRGRPIPLP
jgi:acyl-CoA thioesterase YciA